MPTVRSALFLEMEGGCPLLQEFDVPLDFLEEHEFYELMQQYRHLPLMPQSDVIDAYEAVKAFIRRQVTAELQGSDPGAEEGNDGDR